MNCLKLEAADLRNRHRILSCRKSGFRIGISDIPHHKYRRVIGFHDLSHQSRGGRFSVGSGNGNHAALAKMIRKLYLSPYGNSFLPEFLYKRRIHRHTGADHQKRDLFLFLLRNPADEHFHIRNILCLLFHFVYT